MKADTLMLFLLNHDCVASATLSDDKETITITDIDERTETIPATRSAIREYLNY